MSDQETQQDDAQQEAQSATADKVPETGADIEEGEVHGDASQLDTDVEQRIDEAGSAKDDGDDDGGDADDDVDEEAIEKERQERLDPDNRPQNAEVDNSARDFDIASGQFTDHEKDVSIGPFNDPTAPDGEIEA